MILSTLRLRARALTAAVATSAFLAAAMPALAQACTPATGPVRQTFKQFGDLANYSLVPGGSFEAGTSGWSLTDASVTGDNESFHVTAASDSHSLAIAATGSAVSAPLCVTNATPTFRFFARRTAGTWAQMNVNILWTDSAGVGHRTTAGSLTGTTTWAVSPVLLLGAALPLWQSGSSLTVRLQFLPAEYGAAWAIDDVYVDPYSK